MDGSMSQIIEIHDPSGEVPKPVLLVKNVDPSQGPILTLPVKSSVNTSVVKVFRSENVTIATGKKCSKLKAVTMVNDSTVDVKTSVSREVEAVLLSPVNIENSRQIYMAPTDISIADATYVTTDTPMETITTSSIELNNAVGQIHHSGDGTVLKQTSECLTSDKQQKNQDVKNDAEIKSPVIMFKWGTATKPFRCQICDLSFADGNFLRTHMEKHESTRTEPVKPFPCSLCMKSFQSNRSLERHQFVHSGQSQKRCKYCYKVFANRENLDKHILMHNATKSLICPFCNENCSSRNALERHITFHTGQKHFVCNICEKTFNRKDTLSRHLLTHNVGKRNKHQCVECEKSFSFLFALKRHVRSVHGEEPDGKECEICGKFIKNRENVGRHMQIHEGKRPYACTNCGRKFTQKQHLVDHLVIHTSALPFECKICGLSFRYKRSLNRHHKKHFIFHSDNQKLECVKCSDLFSNQQALTHHIEKVHCKVHQCMVCKLSFSVEEFLLKHMVQKHGASVETGSSGRNKVNLVHKSTETDPVAMETTSDLSVVHKLPIKRENINAKIVHVNEAFIGIKGDGETVNNETIESRDAEDNIVHTTKESDIVSDCQEIIYIVYNDNGQEVIHKVIDNKVVHKDNKIVLQTGEHFQELNEHQMTGYALDGTQIVHIADIGTPVNEQEMENDAETVELTECVENDNQVVEAAEEYPNVHVYQADQDGDVSNYSTEEAKFVTDRTELIQSLIDYAEKIQEEELSMTGSETKI